MEIFYFLAPLVLIIFIFIIVYITKFSTSKTIETGKKLLSQKKVSEALNLFKNLVNKRPFDPNVHFYLAESYYTANNYDWALTEFKKVESFNRADYKYFSEKKLHERLADLYLRFGKTTEAQKSLLSILEVSPEDYNTHIKIGDIFFKRTLFDNALSYYQKALSINSKGAEALYKCGEVFYYKKDFNQALGYLQGAVKNDQTKLKAHYYIGMIYKTSNNYAKAVSVFEQASQKNEVRVQSLYQKGTCLVKLGENAQAIASFERALKTAVKDNMEEKSSTMLALRYSLASCYENEKKILLALDQWEKISEVNKDYEDVKSKLNMYQDLRVDDKMKDYLTVTKAKFDSICKKIIEHKNQSILEIQEDAKECFEAIVSESEGEWLKARKSKKLVQFHRKNEPIGDQTIRNALEKMKKVSAMELEIYSSSGFTNVAESYSETRPVALIDRDSLSTLLKNAG